MDELGMATATTAQGLSRRYAFLRKVERCTGHPQHHNLRLFVDKINCYNARVDASRGEEEKSGDETETEDSANGDSEEEPKASEEEVKQGNAPSRPRKRPRLVASKDAVRPVQMQYQATMDAVLQSQKQANDVLLKILQTQNHESEEDGES